MSHYRRPSFTGDGDTALRLRARKNRMLLILMEKKAFTEHEFQENYNLITKRYFYLSMKENTFYG